MAAPGTLRSRDIPALLTDEEIIAMFTPLELEFHAWHESGDFHAQKEANPYGLIGILQGRYPYEPKILDLWNDFREKWLGRIRRRMRYQMSRDEFLQLVRSTPCKDAGKLANRLWVYTMHDTPDLILGQSHFGGTTTGYALVTRPHTLYPDVPPDKMTNPNNPDLLDRVVLAVNAEYTPSTRGVRMPASSNKRGRDLLTPPSSESSSGASVPLSLRNAPRPATANDFLGQTPFCVFQIGYLVACTGSNWLHVRSHEDILAEAEWEDTGYGVVVHLDKDGLPTGEVFVIFNYWRRCEEEESGTLAKEIKWKDGKNTELPHIRRLYPDCETPFFMAKIADKLEKLKEGVNFNFEVLFSKRQNLIMAKKVTITGRGSRVMIIPNDNLDGFVPGRRHTVGQSSGHIRSLPEDSDESDY